MSLQNSPYQIICEGASERNYLMRLNRLLFKGDFTAAFSPHCANTGYPGPVLSEYRRIAARNRGTDIFIWVDKDIYITQPKKCQSYESSSLKSRFFFSVMNFEDFAMLHCEPSMLKRMSRLGHFSIPVSASAYEKELLEFFPGYRKGDLPFELSQDRLKTLFQNISNPDIPIQNDFARFLCSEIQKENLKFFPA